MSEERLKEIKDSIDFQLSVCDIPEYETSKLLAEEEIELYNEVVRLRKIIDKINHVMNNQMDYHEFIDIVDAIDDILKQNNLTLEQLTGVENE